MRRTRRRSARAVRYDRHSNSSSSNLYVTTSGNHQFHVGSAGVSANNSSLTASSTSIVSVTAYGTINSGTAPLINNSPAAGIVAGYNSNNAVEANNAGNVVIDSYATITAPTGTYGIEGYTFGTGSIQVTQESARAYNRAALVFSPLATRRRLEPAAASASRHAAQ